MIEDMKAFTIPILLTAGIILFGLNFIQFRSFYDQACFCVMAFWTALCLNLATRAFIG